MAQQVPLCLLPDASLDPAALARAHSLFSAAGVSLTESPHATAVLTTLEGRPPAPEVAAVVLFDGQLAPMHAPMLTRPRPALLLAEREEGPSPSLWEVQLLCALLEGRSLVPAAHNALQQLTLCQIPDIQSASGVAAHMVLAVLGSGKRNLSGLAADVMHELAANALLDAPVNADGVARYAHRRDSAPEIAAEDACQVRMGVAENFLFLEATDRFGRLQPIAVARSLSSLGQQGQIQAEGGGAGLGLRRMIEHSDALAIRVKPGRETTVLCAINLGDARRRATHPKSLFFWLERG